MISGIRVRPRFLALLAACAVLAAQAEVTLKDDIGRTVSLARPAQRIVTLAPNLTELAFSAGVGDRVVAVSEYSDWPPEARSRPTVSSSAGVSIESVAALRPDLVLAWQDAIRPADVERFTTLGIAVFVTQARKMDDAPRLLEAVGILGGADVKAQAARFRATLEAMRARHAAMPRMPVLLEIGHHPLMTLAGPHWINEALEMCGARNVFADLPGVAPLVPWELAAARDPRAIVGAGSAANEREFRAQWADRPGMEAVRAGRLVFVQADLVLRPTLRLAEGVAKICAGLDAIR